MNYNSLAKEVIKYVGGKENINHLEHCMTRLRFDLKDISKVEREKIEQLDGVIALKNSAGQIQVVIGNEVAEVYKEVIALLGTLSNSTDTDTKQKKSPFAVFIDFISAALLPAMAIMCASGLIKGLNVIVSMVGLYQADSGYYALINGVGDAIFYFLPIVVGYNAAKKLKMSPLLGLAIGAILCYPALNGTELAVFGTTITVSYTSTFAPVLILVLIAAPLERFLNKIIPNSIKMFIVPALVLLLVVPLGFVFIGPVANQISTFISTIFIKMYDISPIVTGFALGGTILLLIVFGLHTIIGLSNYLNVIQGIPDPIMPLKAFSTIAITAAVFAVLLRSKDKKIKEVALPAGIAGLLGVTEPALYGVAVPNIRVFIFASLGSAVGGVIAAIYDVHAYAFTGTGFFTFLGFLNPEDPRPFPLILGIVVAAAISFILTFLFYKENTVEEYDIIEKEPNDYHILAPIAGEIKDISQANDSAFSSAAVGEGIVVEPNEGLVFAPFNGTVDVLFPTLHAIGLKSENGVELLIHVGEDTVNLNGEGFNAHVKQGDIVESGQLLIEFDQEFIKSKGYSCQTPVIITNKDMYKVVDKKIGKIDALDKLMVVEEINE